MLEVSDELYETMQKRDRTFDGTYFVGIVSTGIVCFPSCKSRIPNRENVRAYATLADALKDGFRPCKRCKPDNPDRQSPESTLAHCVVALYKQHWQEPWTLTSLASELKISPYHLQRTFKRVTGISPAQQLQQIRMDQAQQLLASGQTSIREVARAVGFRSSSHFSAAFQKMLGTTPAEYRKSRREG